MTGWVGFLFLVMMSNALRMCTHMQPAALVVVDSSMMMNATVYTPYHPCKGGQERRTLHSSPMLGTFKMVPVLRTALMHVYLYPGSHASHPHVPNLFSLGRHVCMIENAAAVSINTPTPLRQYRTLSGPASRTPLLILARAAVLSTARCALHAATLRLLLLVKSVEVGLGDAKRG
jgi:hypothetical protein